MGDVVIMRRTGGWHVELLNPVTWNGQLVTFVELAPCSLGHSVRWAVGEIPSALALVAELSGMPEAFFLTLLYPDVDRVMTAFSHIVPSNVGEDWRSGRRPLVTPASTAGPDAMEIAANV